jgi:hypothetical protein
VPGSAISCALAATAFMVLAQSASAETQPRQIVLAEPVLRLSSLAVLPAGISDRVVARLPVGQDRLLLSEHAVATLLRRELPGQRLVPIRAGAVELIRAAGDAVEAPNAPACSALAAPVEAGDYVAGGMLVPAICQAGLGNGHLRFDRNARSLVATADLPAGTYVGRTVLTLPAAPLNVGTSMRLRIVSGPVAVERPVHTLQPARRGEQVFVATADGDVFVARIAEEEAQQ